MAIRFACRNGHLMKTDDCNAGRNARCPRCHVTVRVPEPKLGTSVTDTQAARLVGSYSPGSGMRIIRPAARIDDRRCPKCRHLVAKSYRICPNCHVYIGGFE